MKKEENGRAGRISRSGIRQRTTVWQCERALVGGIVHRYQVRRFTLCSRAQYTVFNGGAVNHPSAYASKSHGITLSASEVFDVPSI